MNGIGKVNSKERGWFLRIAMDLVQTLFLVSLFTFLLLVLLETVFEGSVRYYIDFNQLLILVVTIGSVAILSTPKESCTGAMMLNSGRFMQIICYGIGGGVVIWYKTQHMGWFSYIISVVSLVLIVLLLTITWQGEGIEEEDS